MKSVFGVAGAVVPVLYCASLLYYFLDLSGSVQEAESIGLGPTVLGLGAIGLLLSIPLIIKVTRIFAGQRSPESGGAPSPDGQEAFDADAMIARYRTRQSAEDVHPPAAAAAQNGREPAKRSSFGRRTR